MSDRLGNVKNQLRAKFLGKAGIHAFGLSRRDNAIRVYVNESSGPEQDQVLEQIRREAGDVKVAVIAEPPPSVGHP